MIAVFYNAKYKNIFNLLSNINMSLAQFSFVRKLRLGSYRFIIVSRYNLDGTVYISNVVLHN